MTLYLSLSMARAMGLGGALQTGINVARTILVRLQMFMLQPCSPLLGKNT